DYACGAEEKTHVPPLNADEEAHYSNKIYCKVFDVPLSTAEYRIQHDLQVDKK
ncbi:hypothetical protein AVEN_160118-1, partial [Araneus ventricosus]